MEWHISLQKKILNPFISISIQYFPTNMFRAFENKQSIFPTYCINYPQIDYAYK